MNLNQQKTRLSEFGRKAAANRRRRSEGRPSTFEFLGLTHYCTISRSGRFMLGRRPIAKRVRRTLKAIKQTLRSAMHDDPKADRGMARQGAAGLAKLLCRPDQQ